MRYAKIQPVKEFAQEHGINRVSTAFLSSLDKIIEATIMTAVKRAKNDKVKILREEYLPHDK